MTIRYKRMSFVAAIYLPAPVRAMMLHNMCNRIDLPSRIGFVDLCDVWAMVA